MASSLELVSTCSGISQEKLLTSYQLACANQDFTFEDDEEDGDPNVMEGDMPLDKKKTTECAEFIDDFVATNDSEFVMDDTKAPDAPKEDSKLLEIPDADVLKNLLERQNVQDCT